MYHKPALGYNALVDQTLHFEVRHFEDDQRTQAGDDCWMFMVFGQQRT